MEKALQMVGFYEDAWSYEAKIGRFRASLCPLLRRGQDVYHEGRVTASVRRWMMSYSRLDPLTPLLTPNFAEGQTVGDFAAVKQAVGRAAKGDVLGHMRGESVRGVPLPGARGGRGLRSGGLHRRQDEGGRRGAQRHQPDLLG